MSDVVVEFPKWVNGVVVQTADEESAVREGRAVFKEVRSAYGSSFSIASITPRPDEVKLTAEPPDAEAMIREAQETFTRRKSKRKGK